MKIAALGLGSNRGDRKRYLREALATLRGVRLIRISPLYESEAMLPAGAPASWNQPFFNLVALGRTELAPLELLREAKRAESELGRAGAERWAPREIDIDVLAYADATVVREPGLSVPHSGLLERPFALLPLADVAPEWLIGGRAVGGLAQRWRHLPAEQVPFTTRPSAERLAALVGIVNITPDSFSDGGKYSDPRAAVAQALGLQSAGAEVLDLGAESTRPGAVALSPDDEWRRLAPVLERLRGRACLSVDTRHAEVARLALKAGADWLNDVTGFEDEAMIRVAANSDARLVVMHSLGIPPTKERILPHDRDPVAGLLSWGERKLATLEKAGIARSRVILDPGIGFGKSAAQSLEILAGIRKLHELGARLFVGHSRKSFLSRATMRPPGERDLETALATAHLAKHGVQYIRVHDIEANARALRVAGQLDGVVEC